uniref:Uncharacterized protein n=1 Tax=Parascaris equorum TaxID=6256 RepID=A0A914S691_PAREQ
MLTMQQQLYMLTVPITTVRDAKTARQEKVDQNRFQYAFTSSGCCLICNWGREKAAAIGTAIELEKLPVTLLSCTS